MVDKKKPYALFISYPDYIRIVEYPDNITGYSYSYDDTKVEIGKDGVFIEEWEVGLPDGNDGKLDIAYSKTERENADHVKAKRFQITREANVFLRHMHTLVVPKDYYEELVKKWSDFTGKKYETACEMLKFKEDQNG